MPLKITKAADPIEVKQIALVVYAPPGVGKTSMGFSAEAPLLLDFDKGAYRSQFRKDTVQIESWPEVENISAEDLAPYKTVIVDTAGRALDVLSADIIRLNPKHGRGGALTLQGFGELKARFIAWTKMLRGLGKDIVLLAHMDEQRNGDEVIERLDVQGGSKGEIYKCADAMARIQLVNGQRMLNFNPTDVAFGKNPAQLEVLKVPNYTAEQAFLAGVITQIKSKLNEQGEAALKRQAELNELRESFEAFENAEQFTKESADLTKRKAEPAVKALLLAAAEKKGFIYDKPTKAFVAKPQAQQQAA